MSDLKLLKKRIYNDERIEEVLDALGCKNIHRETGMFVAALPTGNNRRSVQVKNNENLAAHIRSKGISGDIYSIVSYIKFGCSKESEIQQNLSEAKLWLIAEFGYQDVMNEAKAKESSTALNGWLMDLRKKRVRKQIVEEKKPNLPIDENVKNSYLMLPYKSWIDEGISWDTQVEWETGFDWCTGRVVTLVRNVMGELIGVKGRALRDDDERKYMYIERMNKSIELFGLHKTLPYILEQKEILLFEGYKSVFKAWELGYKNCASIEGDDISPEQVALIKSFGIDIKIVGCFDNDKTKDEVLEQMLKMTSRKVFFTSNTDGLLTGKESPVDRGLEVWERIYQGKQSLTYYQA